jgi:hypothetical protein
MSTPFKYLFTARLHDGTTFTQTQADVSSHTPDKNAFFDVLQRIDEVETFSLIGGRTFASVDLDTGLFNVNGLTLTIGDPSLKLTDPSFRLIFFKRNMIQFTGDEREHSVKFHLGWQCTQDGRNIQNTIGLE